MKRDIRWTWTNWTFGVWWDRKKLHAGGIDIGPLEIVWRRPRPRPDWRLSKDYRGGFTKVWAE